jgi:hypothetical protein
MMLQQKSCRRDDKNWYLYCTVLYMIVRGGPMLVDFVCTLHSHEHALFIYLNITPIALFIRYITRK